jgi:hypothetical protein
MYVIGTGNSCRYLFKEYKILILTFVYILEVICFIKKCKFLLQQNVHVHDKNVRKKWIYTFYSVIRAFLRKVRSAWEFDYTVKSVLV